MRLSTPESLFRCCIGSLLVVAMGTGCGWAFDDPSAQDGVTDPTAQAVEEAHPAAEHASDGHAHAEDDHADHQDNGHADDGHHASDHGGDDYNQVPLVFKLPLFLWSLVLFALFLLVSRKVAWIPLIQGLDARESRVNRALHDAEAARVHAEKLLAEHATRLEQVQDEVKSILAAARKEAEAEKARIIAEADAEAAIMRDNAIAQIREAHQQALGDLQAQIDRQADAATAQVLS